MVEVGFQMARIRDRPRLVATFQASCIEGVTNTHDSDRIATFSRWSPSRPERKPHARQVSLRLRART